MGYSGRVRQELHRLASVARQRGLGPAFVAALKDVDRRLRIYPQFGEPLYNLNLEPSQVWIGSIAPLVVRYTVDDERRLVMVIAPFLLLPKSGL